MKQAPVNIKNKRATFDYELTDTYRLALCLRAQKSSPSGWGKQA